MKRYFGLLKISDILSSAYGTNNMPNHYMLFYTANPVRHYNTVRNLYIDNFMYDLGDNAFPGQVKYSKKLYKKYKDIHVDLVANLNYSNIGKLTENKGIQPWPYVELKQNFESIDLDKMIDETMKLEKITRE